MLRIEPSCLGLAASLSLLACADDTPRARGDSGQSATASDASAQGSGSDAGPARDPAVGLDAALPDAATGGDAASRADGGDAGVSLTNLSCEQLTQTASTALRGALEASPKCTLDTECKTTWLTTTCYDGCGGTTSPAQAQRLESAITEQNSTTCAAFRSRGCTYLTPPCDPPGAAVCIAGECRAYRGSLPVATPDAGAGGSTVVLDNPASPATADLVSGQRLELTLRSVGPGAYTEPAISAVALRFVESFLPRLPNPGGPTKVFVFEAVSPGSVQVSIPHSTRADAFKLSLTIR